MNQIRWNHTYVPQSVIQQIPKFCSSEFDRILLDRTELTDAYLTECVVDRIRVDRMRT